MIKRAFLLFQVLLLTNIIFSECVEGTDVCLSIEDSKLLFSSTSDIYGFQFDHSGCATEAKGGSAQDAAFSIKINEKTVLGFSFEGNFISPGNGTLIDLGSNDCDESVLTNFVFAGTAGKALSHAFNEEKSYLDQIDNGFGILVGYLAPILFADIFGIPLIVLTLMLGALVFTFYFGFINVRGFKHSIEIIRGKYDNPDDTGQISHFQALTSALSATIGLGNIAGVAVAVSLGGPGAVFWMVFIAFFSMSAKFVSCTLGQLYRKINEDGSVSGGPMYYLDYGLKEKGFSTFGKVLGAMYAVFIIGGAFGGGNMFQANQSYELFGKLLGIPSYIYGILLAMLVAVVIVGGIKRIGETTEKIVPFMVVLYVGASLFIILTNIDKLPGVISSIISQAFNPDAAYGGFIGALVTGIKRGVFSNEGGVGSASIAHSAAKTDEPVREGIVAMIGPFIDTIVVCFMTASVILITADMNPMYIDNMNQMVNGEEVKIQGAELTSAAFGSAISWFPYILSIVVFLFSFSTMISWYYYGDKGWKYLFGSSSIQLYQGIYLGCVVLGAVSSLGNVIDFSDMMILSCGFPNIIGCMFLLPIVKSKLDDYWTRYKANEFKVYK